MIEILIIIIASSFLGLIIILLLQINKEIKMGKLTDIYDDSGNLVASIDLNEIIGINSINPNFSEIILSGGVKIGVMRNLKNIKSDYEIN